MKDQRARFEAMTPTREQYEAAARFCGIEITFDQLGGSGHYFVRRAGCRLIWAPLSAQHCSGDGLALLAAVGKWVAETWHTVKHPRILTVEADYRKAAESGNVQSWLEAGFMLAVAVGESMLPVNDITGNNVTKGESK